MEGRINGERRVVRMGRGREMRGGRLRVSDR